MKPLRVKASVSEEPVTLCAIYFAAVLAMGALAATPYAGLMGLALCLAGTLIIAILLRHRRLKGREVQIDEEGVSSLIDGQVVASVPWTRYGGFRKLQVPTRVRLWYPERCGTELLDKQGVVLGVIPLEKSSRVRAKQTEIIAETLKLGKIFHELESRSAGWREPEARQFSTSSKEVRRHYVLSAAFLLPSIAILALAIRVVNEGFESLPGAAVVGLTGIGLGCLACFVLAGAGLINLFRAELGRKWLSNPIQVDLRATSRWTEVEEAHVSNLDRFGTEPGRRYRYATAQRNGFLERHVLHFFMLSFSPVLLIPLFVKSNRGLTETLSMLVVLASMLLALGWGMRYEFARQERLKQDVLVRTDDGLVVLRNDGSHLTFSLEGLRKAPVNANPMDRSEIWLEGKRKYTIALRDLVEMEEPDEAVKAELAELLIAKDSPENV